MTDLSHTPPRYTSVYTEDLFAWQVYDRQTQRRFGNFANKFTANRRCQQLQVQHNKMLRQQYGMQHPQDAPPARAYKDD